MEVMISDVPVEPFPAPLGPLSITGSAPGSLPIPQITGGSPYGVTGGPEHPEGERWPWAHK